MNTPTSTADTETREAAAKIVLAFERADGIQAQLLIFDEETAAKLAALDNEIAGLEHHLDAENVGEVQRLVILREQRKRLETQLAEKRETLRARVRRDAGDVVSGLDIPAFFRRALESEIATVTAAMLPFFENEIRARGAAGQSDSVAALQRWAGNLSREISAANVSLRLQRFVDGHCPLWRI